MSNDIAKLGFSADTNDLKKAKADLEAIVPAADKVDKAAKKAGDSLSGAGNKAQQAASGMSGNATASDKAAAGLLRAQAAADKAAMGLLRAQAAADRAAAAAARAGNAGAAAGDKLARMGQAANDNLNRVQATPANIAAQFQDIAVTAAAGMNPMIIAMQQGTQLSVAFSQGLAGLGPALAQMFSKTTLLTIGMVGLVAALIEAVDWMAVGKSALYTLADAFEQGSVYIVMFAGSMALINAPVIISGIVGITKAVWGLVAGLVAAVGIPTLIVAGLVAIVAAANIFRDDLTKILGFDIVKTAKDGVNAIVGGFVGAYYGILAVWRQLPSAVGDLVIQAVNWTLRGIDSMINGAINRINRLTKGLPFGVGDNMQMGNVSVGQVGNPNSGAASKVGSDFSGAFSKAQGVDYVGKSVSLIERGGKYLADKLRGIANGLGAEDGKGKNGRAAEAAGGGKTDAEKFGDIMGDADRKIASLKAAGEQIGMYGEALATAKAKQDMLNDASRKGLALDEAQMRAIQGKAAEIGKLTAANEKAAFIEQGRQDHELKMAQIEMERQSLGLYGVALDAATLANQRLLEAKRHHIELTPQEIQSINDAATAQAEAADKLAKQKDAMDTLKGATKGFFMDVYQGVKQGKSVLDSLADAFSNMVDKIIDKILSSSLDSLIDNLFSGGGGGGGILDGITSILTSALGGGGFAKGGAFGFANGGAFTNGVVDRPTAFAFGKGGANLGIMGEAGPEAVMPLTRGANGSLGVRMYDAKPGGGQTIQLVFNNNHTVSGAVSSQDIIDMNKRSAEQTEAQLRRKMPEIIQQYQRDGSLA